LAYELGRVNFEPEILRRNMTTSDCPKAGPEKAEAEFRDAFFHRARALR
jgi:hypothetical protein